MWKKIILVIIIIVIVYFLFIPIIATTLTSKTYGVTILPDGTATGMNPNFFELTTYPPSSSYYGRIGYHFMDKVDGVLQSAVYVPTAVAELHKKYYEQGRLNLLQYVSGNVQMNKLGIKGFWWF